VVVQYATMLIVRGMHTFVLKVAHQSLLYFYLPRDPENIQVII
jgi:hypothetical protein